jgi:hypothetical protein
MQVKVEVSKHARRRLRERLGIPYRGAERHAQRAFYDGNIVQPLQQGELMLVEYMGRSYVFGYIGAPVLVTIY